MVGTHHGDIYKRRNRAKQIIKLMYVTTFLGRKGKTPIMKEKSLSWKKTPYHERKIPIMKEKFLSWKKNPYHERKIPIMKEKFQSWEKNPYHERKIPDIKEKSLSWKGFVTLIFICREWKFLHISIELILLRFKVFSMEIVWKNIFEKIKKIFAHWIDLVHELIFC